MIERETSWESSSLEAEYHKIKKELEHLKNKYAELLDIYTDNLSSSLYIDHRGFFAKNLIRDDIDSALKKKVTIPPFLR